MKRIFLMVLIAAVPAIARPPVPLMPPKVHNIGSDTTATAMEPRTARRAWGLGAELGLLGRRSGSGSDVLGMQLFFGGRVFARIPLWDSFTIKPSIGYFRKSQGEGGAGVTEQAFEGGLVAHYSILQAQSLRWLAGISQRFELSTSTINVPGTSSSESAFRYRVGPSTGIAYGLTPDVSLLTDLEVTFAVTNEARAFFGLTAGLVYYLR